MGGCAIKITMAMRQSDDRLKSFQLVHVHSCPIPIIQSADISGTLTFKIISGRLAPS